MRVGRHHRHCRAIVVACALLLATGVAACGVSTGPGPLSINVSGSWWAIILQGGVQADSVTLDLSQVPDGTVSGSGVFFIVDHSAQTALVAQHLDVTGTVQGDSVALALRYLDTNPGTETRDSFDGTATRTTMNGGYESFAISPSLGGVNLPVDFRRLP
ncbi:MAG TPA: hypothetical protein VFK13_15510 [Gemmatimonadaceae bacterium]|nr:hypothetical protein [Gemmatimonadaceae bacterium]